jgi:selenide,water dikinase
LCGITLPKDPNLIVGAETSDDAGVYRLTNEIALIQTLDFFTPIVDDPFSFGQITAANALSDVYAMGGRPILAMNILACPVKTMDVSVFREVIRGGLDKVQEAGALLVGGHSIEDAELKYGLSVTGVVHPDRVLLNAGARPGDRLILTKPLGIGILSTAIKGSLAGPEVEAAIVEVMVTLNRLAAEVTQEVRSCGGEVHSCTDITGFGLLGHLSEMLLASGVAARIFGKQIPVLAGARDFVDMGIIPEGAHVNRKHYAGAIVHRCAGQDSLELILADPQTSGGLLIAASPDAAAAILQGLRAKGYPLACADIGEIIGGPPGAIELD